MIVFDDLNFYISSIAAVNSALDSALVIRFEARRWSWSSPPSPVPFFVPDAFPIKRPPSPFIANDVEFGAPYCYGRLVYVVLLV